MATTILLTAGCAGRERIDLLESRLRQQEMAMTDLKSRLEQTKTDLKVARRQAESYRRQLSQQEQNVRLPEQSELLARLEGIRFSPLLTGGLDRDQKPGQELLNVLIVPHDADGELIKVPGRIDLEVLDLSQPEEHQRVSRWQFSPRESRDHWHRGFIGSGFLFRLPWQKRPDSAQLVLHARLRTSDGRQFDASHKIRVNLPPAKETASKGESSSTPDRSSPESGEPVSVPRQPEDLQRHKGPIKNRHHSSFPPQDSEDSLRTEPSQSLHTSSNWTMREIPRFH